MNKMIEQLNEAIKIAEELNVEIPLNESVTYFQLRLFISILIKQVRDSATRDMLIDLTKSLAKLEVREVPVPALRKMSDKSIKVFE
jgi:hypothetical protein